MNAVAAYFVVCFAVKTAQVTAMALHIILYCISTLTQPADYNYRVITELTTT